jgi:hypothetical protein
LVSSSAAARVSSHTTPYAKAKAKARSNSPSHEEVAKIQADTASYAEAHPASYAEAHPSPDSPSYEEANSYAHNSLRCRSQDIL